MVDIKLFGSSTNIGQYIKKNHTFFLKGSNLHAFSSRENSNIFFDLKTQKYPKELLIKKDTIFISIAPIWLFVPFLKSFLIKNNKERIRNIIITSSTSIYTKKYSWNNNDKKLFKKLNFWEKEFIDIVKANKMKGTIIRPTLIYGNLCDYNDKNISTLVTLMRNNFILPIPNNTGLRQPIHYTQMGKLILKVASRNLLNNQINIINIGGDEEITYEKMLKRIQANLPLNDLGRYCFILKIPNRLFYLLCVPFLLISPKTFEAIQRISVDLNEFEPVYKYLNQEKKLFPLNES